MILKLKKIFQPKYSDKLIRIGDNNDGGYVMNKNCIKDIKHIIGLGLNDNWSFEEHLKKKCTGAKIEIYDHTVNFKFWCFQIIKNFIKLFYKKNKIFYFNLLFKWIAYLNFFVFDENKHLRKMILSKKDIFPTLHKNNYTSLNKILKNKKKICLKIDIEGSEYLILNEILENQKNLISLLIEFHDIDLHYQKIINFLKKIKLVLCHIHINNHGRIYNNSPTLIEMSFVQKKYCVKRNIKKIYPIKNLDFKNNEDLEDYKLTFS